MKLAELFVEILGDDRPLGRKLDTVRGRLGQFAASARSTLTIPFAIASGAGAAAATAFLFDATQKAADLAETMNKVSVTFGDSARGVKDFARDLSDRFGIVQNVSLDAAANFGLITQGMGLSAEASAELSQRLVMLAADASSFYNVPVADALEKIRAGLVGEAEPLRAFGVNLSEAGVQAEALRAGIARVGEKLTDQQKVMARASLITQGLAKASGDLKRTQEGLPNSQKELAGRFEELKVEIGEQLVPAMRELVGLAGDLNDAFRSAFDTGVVEGFAGALQGAIGATRMLAADTRGTVRGSAAAAAMDEGNVGGQLLRGFFGPLGGLIPVFGRLTGASDRLRESMVEAALNAMGGAAAGPASAPAASRLAAAGAGAAGGSGAGGMAATLAAAARMAGAGAAAGLARKSALASEWTDPLEGARRLQLDALKGGDDPAKQMVREQQKTNKLLEQISKPKNRDDKVRRRLVVEGPE
jgi:hypothetical protein